MRAFQNGPYGHDLAALGVEPALCRRVLAVDDQADNLDVLAAVLDDICEVSTALSGTEALDWIAANGAPDLIITDQRMPGMTGVELLSRVAADHPQTLRMVVTAFGDLEPMLAAVNDVGVTRFLFKPWSGDELRLAIRESLGAREARLNLERVVDALATKRAALREATTRLLAAQHEATATERLATLGRVTATVAHEIRNQLGVLTLLVRDLRDEGGSPALLAAGERALESLAALKTEVADASTFAQSRLPLLDAEPFDVLEEVRAAVARVTATHHGAQVHFDASGEPLFFTGDRLRIRNAVQAIVDNAVLAGGDEPVSVQVARDGGGVTISVEDKGCGMTAAVLAQAREPFFSAFEPARPGLGLSLADMVAAAHQGDLTLASAVNVGTTAVLRLVGPR